MTVATTYEHVVLDPTGVAYIDDTTVKVIEIVMDVIAHGWSPEEIQYQHPHLSLGQIHSALAYYWDHKETIDDEIAVRSEFVEKMQERLSSYSVREKLRVKGLI